MVINPFYDTIIAVTLVCTSLKLIIDRCLYDTKNKILMATDENFGNIKSIKSNKSFIKLDFFEFEEIDTCPEEPKVLLENCFQCQHKFINKHEPSYFAFDKRYCRYCWSSLHRKVFNNRL